jgi:hypothetical protein
MRVTSSDVSEQLARERRVVLVVPVGSDELMKMRIFRLFL